VHAVALYYFIEMQTSWSYRLWTLFIWLFSTYKDCGRVLNQYIYLDECCKNLFDRGESLILNSMCENTHTHTHTHMYICFDIVFHYYKLNAFISVVYIR